MPALPAPFIGFALGALLVWLSGAPLAETAAAERKRRWAAALFAALAYAPLCAYFMVAAPDWAVAYWFEGAAVPSAMTLVWVLLSGTSVVVGHWTASWAERARRSRAALWMVPLAAAALLLVAMGPKLRVDGTYRRVVKDFGTRPLVGSSLGVTIVWLDGLAALGFWLTLRALSQKTAPKVPVVKEARALGGRGKKGAHPEKL